MNETMTASMFLVIVCLHVNVFGSGQQFMQMKETSYEDFLDNYLIIYVSEVK